MILRVRVGVWACVCVYGCMGVGLVGWCVGTNLL